MPVSIYDGSVWRKATSIYIKDGGGTWRTAKNAWIYDGSTWRLGYNSGTISSLYGRDYGGDPLLGLLRIRWTQSGDTSAFTVNIDADLAGGTSYGTSVATGVDPTTGTPYDADMSSFPGFSTLDSTNVRVRLMDGATPVVTLTMAGPYAFE